MPSWYAKGYESGYADGRYAFGDERPNFTNYDSKDYHSGYQAGWLDGKRHEPYNDAPHDVYTDGQLLSGEADGTESEEAGRQLRSFFQVEDDSESINDALSQPPADKPVQGIFGPEQSIDELDHDSDEHKAWLDQLSDEERPEWDELMNAP